MTKKTLKIPRMLRFELTPINIGVVAVVAAVSFGLGFAARNEPSGTTVVPGATQNTGGLGAGATTNTDPAEPLEVLGRIDAIEGDTIVLSGLTSSNPGIALPETIEVVVTANTELARHALKSDAEFAAAKAEFEAQQDAHVAAEEAGQDASGLPFPEEEPDIHNFTTLKLSEIQVGQYAVIGSDDDLAGLSSGRMTATFVFVDDVPVR